MIHHRFSKIFMNAVSMECTLTIFEIIGQEITQILRDIKIKDDAEVNVLKESLKRSENEWKSLFNILLRKFHEENSKEEEQKRLFNLIRFQIQMIHLPAQMEEDRDESARLRASKFSEAACSNVVASMVKYFRHLEKVESISEGMSIEYEQEEGCLDQEHKEGLQKGSLESLYEKKVDLYWIEVGTVSPNLIIKSKNRRLETSGRQMNMKVMMSMHNLKRSFKEFLEFTESFSSYYQRYFTPEEFQENPLEFIRNFSRLIFLFLKGFAVPGRPPFEDVRDTFLMLFGKFKLGETLAKIAGIIKDERLVSLANIKFTDPTLMKEFSSLVYNLYKIAVFAINALEVEHLSFKDVFRILCLTSALLQHDWQFFKLTRLIHFLMHKNVANSVRIHHASYDLEIRHLIILKCINIIKAPENPNCLLPEAEYEMLALYRCLFCTIA